MHADEVDIDDHLVRRLLADQRPDLAHQPLIRQDTWGTDHVIYRLGDSLSVRLPKIGWAAGQGDMEAKCLPLLEGRLTAAVPTPLFVGEAGHGYPYRWCVSPWMPGETPTADNIDSHILAADLALFVQSLEAVGTAAAPPPEGSQRGGPLANADETTHVYAEKLRGEVDVDAALAVWDAGVAAKPWAGPPVWVHADLMEGNLLVTDGRLTGVIDWGGLKVGDPAVELMIGWTYFDAAARQSYRDRLGFVDDDMWLRGRAWAASAALHALPYYGDTNPDIVARSWRTLRAALTEA